MSTTWKEEEIVAFLDGAIEDPAEAVRLAELIETDEEAAALARDIEESNALLRAAFDAPMQEPVPAAIAAALGLGPRVATGSAEASPLRVPDARDARRSSGRALRQTSRRGARRAGQGTVGRWLAGALAASIALGVGIIGGRLTAPLPAEAPDVLALGWHANDDTLGRALETLPSGSVDAAGQVRLLLSFRDGRGRFCREFETVADPTHPASMGIACRAVDASWSLEVIAATAPETGRDAGYRPASGMAEDVLGAALDTMNAGPALTAEDEAALIASGWTAAE